MVSKIGTYNEPLYSELLDKAKTNTTRNSTRTVTVTCPDLWTHAQEFCLIRANYDAVSIVKTKHSTSLARASRTDFSKMRDEYIRPIYYNRARRIAATYARFYLETENDGKSRYKGRYFWMALGAIASKEVSLAINNDMAKLGDGIATSTVNWLAKGNFWLFQDIAGWHYYNNRFGYKSFSACEPLRNWDTLNSATKNKVVDKDVWAEDIGKIKNLKTNNFIKVAFAAADSFVKESRTADNKKHQHMNLLAIADHEQRMILQPLIYEDWRAKKDLWLQSNSFGLAPPLKLTLSAGGSSPYESHAHKGIDMANVEDRMKWIYDVADIFEDYMFGAEKDYMHKQLRIMAGWL